MNKNLVYRKCTGCGQLLDRVLLVKITKCHNTGKILVNPDTKTFGRSVYLCKKIDCLENAFKKNRIFKNLRTKPDENLKEIVKNCT